MYNFSIATTDIKCFHDRVTFVGLWSLIGMYRCDDCGALINPKIYHIIKLIWLGGM